MATSNYYVTPDCAYSYKTCIGVWNQAALNENGISLAIVNKTKYSPTTSRHQNKLIRQLEQSGFTVICVFGCNYGITPGQLLNRFVEAQR
jgi:hypothetical protein